MTSPNWKELNDAYGSAEDLPELLAELEPDPNSPVWGELCSRACHQYSTYSASPHVLPYLLEAAASWTTIARPMPLALAGSIVAAPETVLDGHWTTMDELRLLALDTLQSKDLDRPDRVYVVQSVLAFERDRVWGHLLDRFSDGEFPAGCPECRTYLYVVVGDLGFWCAQQDWEKAGVRSEIQPITVDQLPVDGRRIYDLCLGDPVLAGWVC